MSNKKPIHILISSLVGLAVAAQVSAVIPTCPPAVPMCPNGEYGRYGKGEWLCCKDSTHRKCVNFFKQKYVCNYTNPGEPTTYGYRITFTEDSINLNCDHTTPGACY